MASSTSNDDSSFDDPELPDESDMDRDDDDESQQCPHCNAMIYELADICPNCGRSILSQAEMSPKAFWIVMGVVICVVIVLVLWIR
jgi:RNA polymerase subunit RPABC4/transcription elongation factor Spt4